MPLPVSKNPKTVMSAIKEHHPAWKRDQKVAVMISQMRKAGAHIPQRTNPGHCLTTPGDKMRGYEHPKQMPKLHKVYGGK